jgi:N-acetylglucosaminyl-diphospho-decaprenol L-rhamnosyltransferase
MGEAPLLDTVVVAYESRDVLRACLASLERHPPAAGPMAVHVVDNDSGDGTAEMVRREFPAVHLHALDRNRGFSVANNLVLREGSAPFALLLNPDTEVIDGALDHMIGVMKQRPDVAMAGCRLMRPDGSFDHAAKRSFPTPLSALAHFTGVGRSTAGWKLLGQYRAPELGERDSGEVDAVNGAFMLVRRAAIDRVGLLDEGYWLYMEDLDWCSTTARPPWCTSRAPAAAPTGRCARTSRFTAAWGASTANSTPAGGRSWTPRCTWESAPSWWCPWRAARRHPNRRSRQCRACSPGTA